VIWRVRGRGGRVWGELSKSFMWKTPTSGNGETREEQIQEMWRIEKAV
jgi:hypothetical protein